MGKSDLARKVVAKHAPTHLSTIESILIQRPSARTSKASRTKAGTLGLSLDYDSCVDVLQTQRGAEVPNPFQARGGYISSSSVRDVRLAIAHYFMRGLIEHMASRFASTILFNSSYNQSSARTREFGSIARTYRWRFSDVRNLVEKKGESHAGFKRRTFMGHAQSARGRGVSRFVFMDDLKNNVNAVRSVKLPKRKVTALHADYSRYVTGTESLLKYVNRALDGCGTLVSPGHFRAWAKSLSKL